MFKTLKELMKYAGKHKLVTYIGVVLGMISTILSLIPFVYIWFIIKEAIEVMSNFENATNMVHNAWMAVAFELASMLIYFVGLMCTHKTAFKVAAEIKITCMKHILKMPIGKVNDIGSRKVKKNSNGISKFNRRFFST